MVKKIKSSLGEMLLEQGIISQQQWDQVRQETSSGIPMRKVLIENGFINEEDMVNFISQQLDVPRIELNNHLVDSKLIDLVPEDLARKHQLIPILKIGNNLTCAMVDIFNIMAIDEIRIETGLTVEPAISTEAEIKRALDEHYTVKGDMEEVIDSLDEDKMGIEGGIDIALDQLKGMGEEPPVVKLVNLMIMKAVEQGASDIHVEPEEEELKIRLRIDGILHEQKSPSKHFQSAILSRIKILANLDISERRKPQDGRFQIKMNGREIDIRVSTAPTIYGENIVMRLLDTSSVLLGLEEIGFEATVLEKFKSLLNQPNGIILITGPTGSGKTTTIYGALSSLNTPEKNIITIEDPVEYRLAGVRQMQVNPDVDFTFANGLRSILRQDPDIIMVGEIRDLDTAEIAIQAALTGHLVLATLHTNDAPGAITRLLDMGIEPFLISSALNGVIAQRLVRILCQDCKGKGCPSCFNSGYKGRTGIYEVMVMNDELRDLTAKKSSMDKIRLTALNSGMKILREDGLDKVNKGVTSKEEVFRVTYGN